MCTVGQACTCQLLPEARLYTEGNQVPSGVEVGGLLQLVLRAAPRPQALQSARPGCVPAARAGRAWQRKEHSSRVPTGPGGRRQLLAPPCGPRLFQGAMLAGAASCGHRWSLDTAEARPVFQPRFLAPAAGGGAGRHGVPGTQLRGLRHVRLPASSGLSASPATSGGCFGSEGDLPTSHTARDVGVPARWPSPEDCGAVAAPRASPAQLTRPAVW